MEAEGAGALEVDGVGEMGVEGAGEAEVDGVGEVEAEGVGYGVPLSVMAVEETILPPLIEGKGLDVRPSRKPEIPVCDAAPETNTLNMERSIDSSELVTLKLVLKLALVLKLELVLKLRLVLKVE